MWEGLRMYTLRTRLVDDGLNLLQEPFGRLSSIVGPIVAGVTVAFDVSVVWNKIAGDRSKAKSQLTGRLLEVMEARRQSNLQAGELLQVLSHILLGEILEQRMDLVLESGLDREDHVVGGSGGSIGSEILGVGNVHEALTVLQRPVLVDGLFAPLWDEQWKWHGGRWRSGSRCLRTYPAKLPLLLFSHPSCSSR